MFHPRQKLLWISLTAVTILVNGCVKKDTQTTATAITQAPFLTVVHGTSMEPLLHDGELISVYPTPYTDLAKGDIVVRAWEQDRTIHPCHQIVSGKPPRLVTKGCANANPDTGYCSPDTYIGKVTWHHPPLD